MKRLLVALAALSLVACGPVDDREKDLKSYGTANAFVQTEANAFQGIAAIENSMVHFNGTILGFFDPGADSSMNMVDLGKDGRSFIGNRKVLTSGARFSYVLEHMGNLYNFVTRNGQVYLLTSLDGVTWLEHGIVLSSDPDPNSPWHQIWNVGVTVESDGVFHLVAEIGDSRPNQLGVGLGYARSDLGNFIFNFDSNKSVGHVVPYGGNPYITYVAGQGLLVVHGQAHDPHGPFGSEWYVTASTFDGTTWVTHKDKFTIGAPSIHVCDPHVIDTPRGLLMTVSHDQNRLYKLEASGETFATLFTKLRGN